MIFNHICIIGLGYIGLPTASTFAVRGIRVTGVDTNPDVIRSLRNGKIHIFEPGLGELVQAALRSGLLEVNTTPVQADAFIIAVPTPFYGEKKADLRYVHSAAEAIIPVLKRGNLVVLESTSPPLTTRNHVLPILEKSGLKAGVDFLLAYSPERVLPGQILKELVDNARVIGGIDWASAEAGRDLYQVFVKGEIILTDATTAEMVKLMENTYRDINIAIANEFSRLADRFGVDAWEAIQIANRHPRVKILNPGPGVGGHCISVDPWFFVEAAPDISQLIATSRKVNDGQPEYVLDMLQRRLGVLCGKTITVLGLAYKPDVDDLRESPAVEVAYKCHQAGAKVMAFEPYKPDFIHDGISMKGSLADAVEKADAVLLLVNHSQFHSIDASELRNLTPASMVFDTVNGWDRTTFQDAGFKFYRLGDGKNIP